MREKLPPRRHSLTEVISTADGSEIIATVGFAPHEKSRLEFGPPRELFLSGPKVGADMAAILDDVSVVVSVALQHGITARQLAHSVSPGLATVIGAALELVAGYEEHGPNYRPASLRLIT